MSAGIRPLRTSRDSNRSRSRRRRRRRSGDSDLLPTTFARTITEIARARPIGQGDTWPRWRVLVQRTDRTRHNLETGSDVSGERIPGLREGRPPIRKWKSSTGLQTGRIRSGVASASITRTGSVGADSVFELRSDATGKAPGCPSKERSVARTGSARPVSQGPPAGRLPSRRALVILRVRDAGIAQLVERQLPKLDVAGSNPVARSIRISAPGSAGGDPTAGTLPWFSLHRDFRSGGQRGRRESTECRPYAAITCLGSGESVFLLPPRFPMERRFSTRRLSTKARRVG